MFGSGTYVPQPMLWPGVSVPEAKFGSPTYNVGQKEYSFISKCACLFSTTKSDTQEQVKSKTKMTDEQFIQVFGDVPENISFDAMDKIPAGIEALNGINLVLSEVMSNGNNLDIYKKNGYFDSLAIFALIDNLEFPKLDKEIVKLQLDPACIAWLESVDNAGENEGTLRAVRDQINGLLGSLLEKIDPERAKILAKDQPKANELKDLLKYIQDDFIDDVAKKTDLALTDEQKKTLDEIESKLKIKAITPAVATVGLNIVMRAISGSSRIKTDIAERQAREIEKDKKRGEIESAAKKRNEAKRAEKKRSKNHVASK